MPLVELDISYTGVVDLKPLRGMPLRALEAYGCRWITDLSPLRGMSLTYLGIGATGVTDVTPLRNLPLLKINIRDGTPVIPRITGVSSALDPSLRAATPIEPSTGVAASADGRAP
jgi:hypothetical protein